MSEIEKDLGELLREHRGGIVLRDASRAFGELVDKVLELDLSGSLTIKIGVKPEDEGSSVKVGVDVVVTPPKAPTPGPTVFYARHGTLVPFDEPVGSDAVPSLSPETADAMAVSSVSDDEDRRLARAT